MNSKWFFLFAASSCASGALGQPVFQGVGFLSDGLDYSECWGASDDGFTAVGLTFRGDKFEGFRWRRYDGMVGIGGIAGEPGGSLAYCISPDGGAIAGGIGSPSSAFLWTEATGVARIDPQWATRESLAIDVARGGAAVVGYAGSFPFRWTPEGGFDTALLLSSGKPWKGWAYAVSDDGRTVCGQASDDSQGVVWTPESGGVKIGLLSPTDISGDGRVVVGAMRFNDIQEAVRWTAESGPVPLPRWDGSMGGSANAVSDDGRVIVMEVWMGTYNVPAIWIEGLGTFALVDYLAGMGISTEGWSLRAAWGMSTDGTTIVGKGVNPNLDTEGWIARIGTRFTRCRLDCSEDGRLDVNDFICFQADWRRAGAYGDFDGNGRWNVNDFVAFQAAFRAGCH